MAAWGHGTARAFLLLVCRGSEAIVMPQVWRHRKNRGPKARNISAWAAGPGKHRAACHSFLPEARSAALRPEHSSLPGIVDAEIIQHLLDRLTVVAQSVAMLTAGFNPLAMSLPCASRDFVLKIREPGFTFTLVFAEDSRTLRFRLLPLRRQWCFLLSHVPQRQFPTYGSTIEQSNPGATRAWPGNERTPS